MNREIVETPGVRMGAPLARPPVRTAADPREVSPPGFPEEFAAFVAPYVELDASHSRVVNHASPEQIDTLLRDETQAILCQSRVNDVRYINKFFRSCNRVLPRGGVLVVRYETKRQRKTRIFAKYPKLWALLVYTATTFLLHRVSSKLPGIKRLYFALTRGKNRPLSRAEVLGRLYCCGFEVNATRVIGGLHYVVASKSSEPPVAAEPSYGPVFAMERVGYRGERIRVFKLRTMHPYSEFLQKYVYERNALADGGKLQDDFRVTGWGRWMRRLWIDELPMLVNLLRGELKLVGVRPLSAHYEQLYPAELRERRRQVRPGLVPPFYADLPRTFDEIVESESRYLAAYAASPLRTDARYLGRAVYNIVVKRARSG
jgi:hypothetical protein